MAIAKYPAKPALAVCSGPDYPRIHEARKVIWIRTAALLWRQGSLPQSVSSFRRNVDIAGF